MHRGELFPLLKAFIKGTSFTNIDRVAMYGVSEKDYVFVENMANCDVVILTMSWNYYKKTSQMQLAMALIIEAATFQKKVYSCMSGDFGVEIPCFENVVVLRSNGYKSKLPANHIGLPAFIRDPLKNEMVLSEYSFNLVSQKPLIGFCGQTNGSFVNTVKEIIRVVYRNMKYYLKLSINASQKVMSSSYLRNSVLKLIKSSNLLNAQFIERKKYRAGVKTISERTKTTQEFYDNIKNTQYTVCVRGGGNFSVRLYETLAMGRIPIFVNTDCLVPFEQKIDWKKYVVWVEENELNDLPEVVFKFHKRLSVLQINELMLANRTLWKTKLSFSGFFNTLFLENISYVTIEK